VRTDLRDYFAIHFATALTREQRYSLEFIAGRAYDLADAMITERERRVEAELVLARDADDHAGSFGPLLDEPLAPPDADSAVEAWDDHEPSLDPRWLEPVYDPAWDVEKFRLGREDEPSSQRPGLARTRREEADALERDKKRTG
jgi:hypothetical protein